MIPSLLINVIASVLFAFRVFAFDADLSSGYESGDLELTVKVVVQNNNAVKEPVLLLILKNASNNSKSILDHSVMVDFHVHVFSKTGKEIVLTDRGKQLSLEQIRKVHIMSLKPGESAAYELSLRECFKLLPGETYRISARRYLSDYEFPREGRLVDENKYRILFTESNRVLFEYPRK